MGSKLQRNAIMTGYINSYCLVCDCYFETDDETGDHILKEKHAGKLQEHPYLEKYGDNHIRKVNKGYFCEFCCLLLTTAAKTSLHIQEKAHYEKKGTLLLRRPPGISAVVAFDDILISERAWHSLTDDTCAICNEEFDNENIHKTASAHLLRLVQNRVEFGAGNNLYRKTDDDSFQCLTCNSVFALNKINEHFTDAEHNKLYNKCKEDMKKLSEQMKNAKKNDANSNDNPKNVDVNECKEVALKSDVTSEEAVTYAGANSLTYKAGNPNAFCRVCETKLPGTLRSMKEHINGKEHKSRLAKAAQLLQVAKAKPTVTKRATRLFIETIVNIENVFHQDVVINEKYCVTLQSFVMITKNGAKFRCQTCEVNIYEDGIPAHTDSPKHEQAMRDTPVVTSLLNEFVREVRSGVYHCGYCNQVLPQWEVVDAHLQAKEHKENKDAASFRLQRHLPEIREHRRNQELDVLRMLFMGHMFRR